MKPVQHVQYYTGFVDPIQYSTWCQNRGCICISSTRRTYRLNPADSCIPPSILKRTILQSRISKKRGKEIFLSLQVQLILHITTSISSVSTCNSTSFQSSHAKKTILQTELILPQEFSKKYYNYKAHPVHTDRRHPQATVPHASKHSTWQKETPSMLVTL